MKRIFKSLVAVGMLFASLGMSGCTSETSSSSSTDTGNITSSSSANSGEIKYSLSIKPTIKGQKYIDAYKKLNAENSSDKDLQSICKYANASNDAYTMYIEDMSIFDGYYAAGSYRKSTDKETVKEYDSDSIDHMLFGIGTDNNKNTDTASTVIYTSKVVSSSTKARKEANDSTTSSDSTSSEAADTTSLVTSVRYENSTPIDNGKFTLQTFNIISTEYKDTDGDGTYESNGDSTYKQLNILLKDDEAPYSKNNTTNLDWSINVDSYQWQSEEFITGWNTNMQNSFADNDIYSDLSYQLYEDENCTNKLNGTAEEIYKKEFDDIIAINPHMQWCSLIFSTHYLTISDYSGNICNSHFVINLKLEY